MKYSIKHFIILATISAAMFACQKEDEGMGEMREKAKLMYVNATVNNGSTPALARREVGVYPVYNGVDFNNHPIQFPGYNGYKAFNPGTMNIRLDTAYSPGSDKPNYLGRTKVMEFPLQIEADNYYTLYSVGTIYKVDTFLVHDNLSLPTVGKAKVLFLNLSLDAGPIDIVNSTTGAIVAANLSYKKRQNYMELEPGQYRLQINAAGTSTVLRPALNVLLEANNILTVWARGQKVPTAGSLGTQALQLSFVLNRWTY
ncbi:MAG TPA: DUF4397 domain-containing protein [Pedobacter sp.]|jgi:hypothetical protein